jgi:hypothetical protein
VVHVLDATRAAADGRDPGVGVQFLQLDVQRKAQIYQLVEYARWEGSSGGASLASRMFEVSASLPPSKIMEALPPDPRVAQPPVASRRPKAASVSSEPKTQPSQSAAASAGGGARRGGSSASTPAGKPVASGRPRPQGSKAPTPLPGSIPMKAPTPLPGSIPAGAKAPTPLPGSVQMPSTPPNASAAGNSGAPEAQAPQAPSQPLDLEKLKLGMTHLAHKRFDQALKLFGEIARDSHADPQAHTWLALTQARIKLRDDDEAGAAEHYRRVLAFDEGHHEARKFVREYHSKRRLSALPFGRYFVKK